MFSALLTQRPKWFSNGQLDTEIDKHALTNTTCHRCTGQMSADERPHLCRYSVSGHLQHLQCVDCISNQLDLIKTIIFLCRQTFGEATVAYMTK